MKNLFIIIIVLFFSFSVYAEIPKAITENKEFEKVEKKPELKEKATKQDVKKDINKEINKEIKKDMKELEQKEKDVAKDLEKNTEKEEVIKEAKDTFNLFKEKKYILAIGSLLFLLLSVLRLKMFNSFWKKVKPAYKILTVSILGILATVFYAVGNGTEILPAIFDGVFSSSFAVYLHENIGKVFEIFNKKTS